jgi:hypothetical protein
MTFVHMAKSPIAAFVTIEPSTVPEHNSQTDHQGTMDYITVDSCHSRWVFDTEHRRFRRVVKGLGFGERMPMTEWRPYHKLDLDQHSDSFVVVLDDAGTRVLWSWRHVGAVCPHCGEAGTEELSLADIAQVVDG